MQQHPGELVLEDLGILGSGEVAVLATRLGVGEDHAVDELAQSRLARVTADGAAEIFRRHDGGGVDAPEIGELHTTLLEDDVAGLPVGLDDVATFPRHIVIGMDTRRCEEALHRQAHTRAGRGGAAAEIGHAGVSLDVLGG